MLEEVRKRLRLLVPLIEKAKKGVLFTDFEDLIGGTTVFELTGTGKTAPSAEFDQFRKKAEHFLKENLAEDSVAKVRSGQPLLLEDIGELQRILVAAGIGDDDSFAIASQRSGNFGLFIRSLVGLDRAAAKEVFNDFLDDKHYNKNQIQFVNLIIDYLTEHGAVKKGRVYESPFTTVAPEGPEKLFDEDALEMIFEKIRDVTATATGTA
jgi:type I restriction enzyme R subunit